MLHDLAQLAQMELMPETSKSVFEIQKQAQTMVRLSESRFREIVDIPGKFVWETDLKGAITYVSDQALPVLGRSLQELKGRSFFACSAPEDAEAARGEIPRGAGKARAVRRPGIPLPAARGRTGLAECPRRADVRPGRRNGGLSRILRGRDRAPDDPGGTDRRARHGRKREQVEVGVPGQHEPRNPHADERRRGHDRAAARHRPQRRAARTTRRRSGRAPTRC